MAEELCCGGNCTSCGISYPVTHKIIGYSKEGKIVRTEKFCDIHTEATRKIESFLLRRSRMIERVEYKKLNGEP